VVGGKPIKMKQKKTWNITVTIQKYQDFHIKWRYHIPMKMVQFMYSESEW
jgi:hypothetical protein